MRTSPFLVELLDEFAFRFYQELDYNLECENGIRIAKDMAVLPMVVIPKNYPDYTSRRVHVAEWIEGEKLSQSSADDVGALVNLGVITYLTQLLDTSLFHADPHPGNMVSGIYVEDHFQTVAMKKKLIVFIDENNRWEARNFGFWAHD